MTNPDLIALANELDDIETDAGGKCNWSEVATVSSALRRLASSDGGVKEGRVSVPEGQTPLNDDLGHKYLDVIKGGLIARDTGAGSPYHGHSLEHVLHAAGWVQRDLRLALDKAKAAPPADAGMREALEPRLAAAERMADGITAFLDKPEWRPTRAYIEQARNVLRNMVRHVRVSLTVPGATTKSDGGAKAGSSPILASKEDQRSDTHGMMPVGDNAANVGSTGVGPSDPSSTRSEETVLTKRLEQVLKVMRGARNRSEPMAVWADDIKAVEDAIALLDQFEIRRKS